MVVLRKSVLSYSGLRRLFIDGVEMPDNLDGGRKYSMTPISRCLGSHFKFQVFIVVLRQRNKPKYTAGLAF